MWKVAFVKDMFHDTSFIDLERIVSNEFIHFFRSKELDVSFLKKLKITLLSLQAVLNDAEEKQIKNLLCVSKIGAILIAKRHPGVERRCFKQGLATSSVADESAIYGRDDDRKILNNYLLSEEDNGSGSKIGVITIVGMVVLDFDVYGSYDDWNKLRAIFKCGGSKIIITTRYESVALAMQTSLPVHYLKSLHTEDCWALLSHHAFRATNSRQQSKFQAIGREIAKRCGGLPLAAEAIGFCGMQPAGPFADTGDIHVWFWTVSSVRGDGLVNALTKASTEKQLLSCLKEKWLRHLWNSRWEAIYLLT
ncbi:unnamed protein product [Sphenostylis stenocarpa]|uniref:NB-ARC domain-containing protein n=1 Tax=Sphenostylis stenocarpa TaxID=92480 RepID=A0AA86VMV5_9FABA|nr:unnamed protein product [Sphenostylis stenocarpa]